MCKLKFSVSMCVYSGDSPSWFKEAVDSVLNQTLPPNEVVLQVDGPVSEEMNKVIYEYEEKQAIKVFRLENNMGHGIARNECLKHCSYDYVAIVDADDINASTRFEKQMICFENDENLSAVSSWCSHFNESIDSIINIEKLPEKDAEIKKYLKKRCPLCQASTIFKKSVVEDVGGYKDWYYAEDYYLWIRLALKGEKFYNVQENLLFVRSTDNQSKRRGGWKYFQSMRKLFIFMRKNKMISYWLYLYNVLGRFVMQVLMPSKLRSLVRKKVL